MKGPYITKDIAEYFNFAPSINKQLINICLFLFQERKHQDDLRILKQRLETVENNQQHQIEELQEIAHSTFKGSLPGLDDHDGTLENSKEKNDIDKSS